MDEKKFLAERFERHRAHLRAVAFRLLGSLAEADDAVQEAWLRLDRADSSAVENLGGWLTTVVTRVSLDVLRSKKARREGGDADDEPRAVTPVARVGDPEEEHALADSVGLALLVVLETLQPQQRVAFVLHDLFELPFEDIAKILDTTEVAARQLASRARQKLHAKATRDDDASDAALRQQRVVVEAFLTAARSGDLQGLLAQLAPDVVLRDATGEQLRGAVTVARFYANKTHGARPALIDGNVGLLLAPQGKLQFAVRLSFVEGRIAAFEKIDDAAALARLELGLVPDYFQSSTR